MITTATVITTRSTNNRSNCTRTQFQNAFHELLEDFSELFDDNPLNDSFTDGGNGSGNEDSDGPAPDPDLSIYPDGWPSPGGGVPVVLSFQGTDWEHLNGNFTNLGPSDTGGGGGGFDPQLGDGGLFGIV